MIDNLWEVLVPTKFNSGKKISVKYHRNWDKKIQEISGGLTILTSAKGRWIGPNGKLFREKMIPVRIICTREEINKIIAMTKTYYKQKAVLAYKVGDEIILK